MCLLLQRVKEDSAGVLEQQRGVGEQERLSAGSAEGECCANGRL